MPGRDGSGPGGSGAMTGRGRGYCALTEEEYAAARNGAQHESGFGFGKRGGRGIGGRRNGNGRCMGRMFSGGSCASGSPGNVRDALHRRIVELETELAIIRKKDAPAETER